MQPFTSGPVNRSSLMQGRFQTETGHRMLSPSIIHSSTLSHNGCIPIFIRMSPPSLGFMLRSYVFKRLLNDDNSKARATNAHGWGLSSISLLLFISFRQMWGWWFCCLNNEMDLRNGSEPPFWVRCLGSVSVRCWWDGLCEMLRWSCHLLAWPRFSWTNSMGRWRCTLLS